MIGFLLDVAGNLRIGLLLVLFFGISILVHELGHFLAARWCGLVIDVFSIGFGPSLWRRKIKGVVYKIGCIPIGGYVALPQLDPTGMSRIQGGEDGEEPRNLPAVAAWKKIVVSLAGAAGNILLAIGLAWLVYWIGMPARPADRSGVVGYVAEDSAAHAVGLREGDEILRVNGVQVKNWSGFRVESAISSSVKLDIRTPEGEEKAIEVVTESGDFGERVVAGVDGCSLCMVLSVEAGRSAAKAGIESGDLIVGMAGQRVYSQWQLIDLVDAHRDQEVPIVVERLVEDEPTLLTLSVTPEIDDNLGRARIGIQFNLAAVERDALVRPTPGEQLRHHAGMIFRLLRALVTPGQAKVAQAAVGGPVAILASYWFIVKTSLMLAVWFTGLLNVNLAIINLLPIPVLDGGHIMFSLWELITRRPVHPKLANGLINVFLVLLVALFVVLSIRDVDRFTPVRRYWRMVFPQEEAAEPEPAPLPVQPEAVPQ